MKNVEKSDGLPAQNVDATSLSVTIVWMSSRRARISLRYLNAPRVHPPKRAERRKVVAIEKHLAREESIGIQSTEELAFFTDRRVLGHVGTTVVKRMTIELYQLKDSSCYIH